MNRARFSIILVVLLLPALLHAQVDKILIPAGTPEDQALQAISAEQDGPKKLAMYEDFLQKFSSNPAAVAYGNWQISQYYQSAGDLQKALDYGDKALAGSPRNLDILVSQAGIAQQMKNSSKVMEYAARGGEIYNSLGKATGSEGANNQDAADADKATAKNSYEYLEVTALNIIANENDAKTRMSCIERFTPAFPNSRFADQIASYTMMALSDLKDMPRLVAYGEKTLASNPNSVPTLLLLANAYADDSKPGSAVKAASYAQKVIDLSKADAPDADRSRKLSAGTARSTLGYALVRQEKTASAIPELKTACDLLKAEDEQSYALALYRLGYAYAKLNKVVEAREVLTEATKIAGPVQGPAQDLLKRVNAARSK